MFWGGMPAGAWGRINPFCKQPLQQKCQRKEASEQLIRGMPVPKAVDPRRQQRLMSCCSSAEGRKRVKCKAARSAARPQGRREARSAHRGRAARRRCRCGARQCTGRHEAASEAPARSGRQEIASRREEKAAARARANLVCCCPLCFLCLLLSDDNQKLAFINAVYSKRNREGTSSNCSRRTKKATQQH